MENYDKQICRLCLALILDGDCEVIEEIKKEILDILLISIDFDLSDNAVACKKCLGKLQECFDFKSICFYVDDYIAPFVDGDVKVDIKNVLKKMTSESINLDDSQICRLCISFIEDEACNYDTSDLKDMLRNCLPEVNLNSVNEPLVCNACLSSMARYYEFMKSCKDVEQKIKDYIQEREDHGIVGKVILEDVLGLKNCGTSKSFEKQLLDVENETECLKNEEAANIKCDEIEIKDELDIGVEVSEAVKSGNGNNPGKNRSLKKRKIQRSNTKRKTFCCPKCPYSTHNSYCLKVHMRLHLDNKVCTCTLCSFVANSRSSLTAHLTKVHSGPTKAFGCHECPYETDIKTRLKEHLLKHKDVSEVEMQECSLCLFKTKYKSGLLVHCKTQHSKNLKMYKCEKCPLQTCYKFSFEKHMRMHADLELVSNFQCEKCPYRCRLKRELLQHKRIHSNKLQFSCDQCAYSSNRKGSLQRHKVVHQEDSERHVYKCKLCDYQAKGNCSIKDHMIRIHTDPSKVPMFKCTLCPYEGVLEKYLTKHMTQKHKLSQCSRPPHKMCSSRGGLEHKKCSQDQLTFKCALCLYVTKSKCYLKRHLLFIHQEAATMRCDQCNFRTKYKSSLQRHMELHRSAKLPKFKCDKCEYSTRRKSHLTTHKLKHLKLGETVAYKCAKCDFQTKYKASLKTHIKGCLKRKNDKKK